MHKQSRLDLRSLEGYAEKKVAKALADAYQETDRLLEQAVRMVEYAVPAWHPSFFLFYQLSLEIYALRKHRKAID